MTIRITAIPRTNSPQSGYHPHFFAMRNNDIIWALPGKGESLSNYDGLVFFWIEPINSIKKLPKYFVKIVAFFTIFIRALFLEKQVFIVHSFLYALPILMAGQQYVIVVHGSDYKYLNKSWSKFIANKANEIFGIGFSARGKGFNVKEIPNIFSLPLNQRNNKSFKYDALFVLRNAVVKNPKYPEELLFHLSSKTKIRIAVIGLDSKDSLNISKFNNKDTTKNCYIDYFGVQSHNEVINIMQKSKILIIPSHSEGVAKAMLEALACGLHVVLNKSINLPEVFNKVVDKVDIYDWNAMNEILIKPFDHEKSISNNIFIKDYRLKSISYLEEVYSKTSSLK